MRTVSATAWKAYISRLSALNKAAADAMLAYIHKYGYEDIEGMIAYAYGVATKYGEGAAALAAQMYDAIAELSGQVVDVAIPAATPSYQMVAKTVQGVAKQSQNENTMAGAIGRLVKQTGADTTLQNALRDGAEFAWIPAGDTCAFCIALASRGWQRASRNAIKGGHAEHIHANCDCTYAIRFDSSTNVRGYDPERYREMYDNADPGGSPKDKINAMRREFYEENKEEINEQKRDAYEKRKELNSSAAEEDDV